MAVALVIAWFGLLFVVGMTVKLLSERKTRRLSAEEQRKAWLRARGKDADTDA
jgi:hypothetical protein